MCSSKAFKSSLKDAKGLQEQLGEKHQVDLRHLH